jgi:hypothetical protein
MGFRFFVVYAAVSLICCCSDASGPFDPTDDQLDGNVVVGDATSRSDASSADGGDSEISVDATTGVDAGGSMDAATPDGGGVQDAGISTFCAQSATATLTATQVIEQASELTDSVILLTSQRTARTARICTPVDCSPSQSCCQTCTATVTADGIVPLRASTCLGGRYGCSGSDCVTVCNPPTVEQPIGYLGVVRSEGPVVVLEVLRVIPEIR